MIAQIFAAAVGVWLMAAPAVLGYGSPAAQNDRIVGPVVATFAIVALWEATRNVRWVNTVLGIWLILAPFLLGYGAPEPVVNSIVAGGAIAFSSLVRGRVEKPYGGGWRSLFEEHPEHERVAKPR